jgi:hypothetical protein
MHIARTRHFVCVCMYVCVCVCVCVCIYIYIYIFKYIYIMQIAARTRHFTVFSALHVTRDPCLEVRLHPEHVPAATCVLVPWCIYSPDV